MALTYVEAISRGLERGQAKFGVVVRQILCCINFRPEWFSLKVGHMNTICLDFQISVLKI